MERNETLDYVATHPQVRHQHFQHQQLPHQSYVYRVRTYCRPQLHNEHMFVIYKTAQQRNNHKPHCHYNTNCKSKAKRSYRSSHHVEQHTSDSIRSNKMNVHVHFIITPNIAIYTHFNTCYKHTHCKQHQLGKCKPSFYLHGTNLQHH